MGTRHFGQGDVAEPESFHFTKPGRGDEMTTSVPGPMCHNSKICRGGRQRRSTGRTVLAGARGRAGGSVKFPSRKRLAREGKRVLSRSPKGCIG